MMRFDAFQPCEIVATVDGLEGVYLGDTAECRAVCLIVAGSGPTDANGNNPRTPRSDNLLKLAHSLAEAGIASLRFDKRGVARSAAGAPAEEEMTLQTAAADVVMWVQWLRTRSPAGKLFLCGHSEGALLSLMAAQSCQVDGLISLCGPGRRLDYILAQQLESAPMPFALRIRARAIMAALVAGRRVGEVEPALAALFRPSVQPFMISLLARNPMQDMAACTAPVLVVGGGRDFQVTREDFDALFRARPEVAWLWLPAMNHALKDEPATDDGLLAIDSEKDRPLAKGLVEGISTFILAHT